MFTLIEVEDAAALHPNIVEVAVVGVSDGSGNEIVKMFVVSTDKMMTVDAVIKHCRQILTAYKVPKMVEFSDALPKSNVGNM